MKGVLFLSTEGACRAPLAEQFARQMFRPDVVVSSAALRPAATGAATSVAMSELGLEPGLESLRPLEAIALDQIGLVVTLSRAAADAAAALKVPVHEHWDLPDPPQTDGGDGATLAATRAVRDAILERAIVLSRRLAPEPALGIIGGSGFYDLPGLSETGPIEVETPFGPPSATPLVGQLDGRRVVFLARHGRDHSILPGEVNARANIYALKRLGVTQIVSVSAVGSLREEIAPGEVVLPEQFIDRTVGRPHTFFGDGAVAHVSLADPVCAGLAETLATSAARQARVHRGATYLCIEGPQFSTRAESRLWRNWGADVVGMTNLPEARLAREVEICYATLALPTDYDCWRASNDEVRVTDVLSVLRANVDRARRMLAQAIGLLNPAADCSCRHALDTAQFTPGARIPTRTKLRLHALLARRLGGARSAALGTAA